jgi:hypothetical protein
MPRTAIVLIGDDACDGRKPVVFRNVTPVVSVFDDLCMAWDRAQVEAYLAYETWRGEHGADAYLAYRAAQDRADAAEEALAGYATGNTKPGMGSAHRAREPL